MDITRALIEFYPNTSWQVDNPRSYETLKWDESNSIPKPSEEELLEKVNILKGREPYKRLRRLRDEKLYQTDWLIVKYLEIDGKVPDDIREYRQALRDLPQTATPRLNEFNQLDDTSFEWPTLNIKKYK